MGKFYSKVTVIVCHFLVSKKHGFWLVFGNQWWWWGITHKIVKKKSSFIVNSIVNASDKTHKNNIKRERTMFNVKSWEESKQNNKKSRNRRPHEEINIRKVSGKKRPRKNGGRKRETIRNTISKKNKTEEYMFVYGSRDVLRRLLHAVYKNSIDYASSLINLKFTYCGKP
jgi:hypothetical protein